MKNYLKIVKCMCRSAGMLLAESFLMMLVLLLFEMMIPLGIDKLINSLEISPRLSILVLGVIIFLAAFLVQCFLSAYSTRLYIRIGNKLLWAMREKIYQVLWRSNYLKHVQKDKDKFRFVLSEQTYTAFAIAVIYTVGGFSNLLTVLAFLIMTFCYSFIAGIILIISIGITLAVSFYTGKTILNDYDESTRAQEKDTAQIYETVDMAETARTNGLQEYFLTKNHRIHNDFMKLSEKAEGKSAFCEGIESSLHSLIYILIAGVMVFTSGSDNGKIVTVLFITNLVLETSQRTQRQLQVIIKNIPVFGNVVDLMERPIGSANVIDPMESPIENAKPISVIHTLSFDHVSLTIGERQILKDISFSFSRGENLIIRGTNGSGKSSILKLILGLYQPSGGSILLNGENIRAFDNLTFYREICYISQDELILNETVGDYLRFITHSEVTEQRMTELREKVNLSREIEKIAENGSTLSGGEKKKLFMLKCLLDQNVSMVILDEIDAGLDAETKELLKQMEKELMADPDKIIIKISHIDEDTSGYDHVIQLT